MANPYLVLGGIAVGIIVAVFGVLAVPGWVKSAQDASAVNDLSHVSIGEAAASAKGFGYLNGPGLIDRASDLGVQFTPSSNVKLCVTASTDGKAYAAVALSPSGAFFARTHTATKAMEASTSAAALTAVGGLPTGVPNPVVSGDCAPGALVPGSGTASGPVGPAPIVAKPAGAVVALNDPAYVAYTSHGLYTLGADNQITRIVDGEARLVSWTGAIESRYSPINSSAQMAVDAKDNLYVVAVGPDGGGVAHHTVYRLAPDGTSEVATRFPTSGPPPLVASSPDGNVFVAMAGTVYRLATDGTRTTVGTYSDWGVIAMTADNAGVVYLKGSSVYKVKDGQPAVAIPTTATMHTIVATPDGTLFGQNNTAWIARISPSGATDEQAIENPFDGIKDPYGPSAPPRPTAVGPDGTLYMVYQFTTETPIVASVAPDGTFATLTPRS
ncbi:hypothetical protein [Microbacterium sp. 77mftsu3.1]|uniref:hypothetical protein n=1 Tax=Microbacterium sp. 77mftsu3.1 TaxID=1761802 RepID=UPI00037DA6DC|nr:hypothetical protein [Microbacterium sp. 77mftsu3.1]SDH33547.1 hypothetical protein SAMN04488590_3059 [Microbacterium sp. 77mftsu3.1]